MRLTLRTLLAYLDNTLDSQDAEALKLKLKESSFATQLVQRIRNSLNNQMLAAPAPDAVGPVEDANAISEYLDSTLSHEQVAEIERACLESDPHLAEAAACHQILTMVLGTPANVSPELRERIYKLPDRSIEEIATGANYSSLAVPEDPSPIGPWADDVPTADATLNPEQPVKPVGVADSGVSDAPTRLHEMEVAQAPQSLAAGSVRPGQTIAGSRPRSITDSEIYGGSIRPSRIAPWLVSLAVAGVLLYALAQIFAPLLARDKKLAEAALDETVTSEILVPADQSTGMVDLNPSVDPQDRAADPETRTLQDPTAEVAEDTVVDIQEPPWPLESTPDATPPLATTAENEGDVTIDAVADMETIDADPNPSETGAPITEPPVTESPSEPGGAELGSETETVPPSSVDLADTDSPAPSIPDAQPANETATDNVPAKDRIQVAEVTSVNALIALLGDEQWEALPTGAPVQTDSAIVCAPTFRGEMVTSNQMQTTLVGPVEVRWQANDVGTEMHLETGRIVLAAGEPESTVTVILAGQPITVTFAEASHVAAVQVSQLRQPGFDPLVEENHTPIRTITAVQGAITISGAGDHTLETGQQWMMYGDEEAKVIDVEQLPTWVETPDDTDLTLEANARKELLSLMAEGDQSLEIALREATGYRKSEVAALAGQTLLALHRGDVYFDSIGILNQPKQRAYWPDHFMALQHAIDQSADSAAGVRDSIRRMDSANGETIMRLLTGYSQQQLIDGGDLELVEFLDSPSMAVRVLAIENLRKIKDTTLYFRAEQENAVRRAQVIKKWMTRQRNGDIRWPE